MSGHVSPGENAHFFFLLMHMCFLSWRVTNLAAFSKFPKLATERVMNLLSTVWVPPESEMDSIYFVLGQRAAFKRAPEHEGRSVPGNHVPCLCFHATSTRQGSSVC